MDPDAALRNLRASVQAARSHLDEDYPQWGLVLGVLDDLSSDIEALDEWLSKGGFLPEAWQLEKCQSIIHHGPGHQSTSRCEERGRHVVHRNTALGRVLEWEGDDASTGFFDESPL